MFCEVYLEIMRFYFLLYSAILFSISLQGQSWVSEHVMSADSTIDISVDHTVDDIAWLSGYWVGTGLGGEVEELWSKPKNGKMICAFRFDDGKDLVFTEHVTMTNTDKGVSMLVKHFSVDFTAWEEPAEFVEFPLIKPDGTSAYYDGCTIIRTDDHLEIYVMIDHDGVVSEEQFSYDLKKL